MSTAYITHPSGREHQMGPGHPEQPARLGAIEDRLIASALMPWLKEYTAPAATLEQLSHAHDRVHIETLRNLAPSGDAMVRIDPDTCMNAHTWEAALHAAGAAVLGVDLVMRGECLTAFCAVRPPGHHAERGAAMGFCFFNNIAVAALHALEVHGLQRVAIVDFDVHYGNGTADIFNGDDRVLLCSSYEYPLYPLNGPAPEASNFANIALPPGSAGAAFRQGVREVWQPALERHQPELLLISAGFDAHAEDPLAELRLVEDDYAWVTHELLRITQPWTHGRCVSALEGGYDLSALGRSVAVHIAALAGIDAP